MKTNYYSNLKTKCIRKYYLIILSLLVFATSTVYGQDKERKYASNQEVRTTDLLGVGGSVTDAGNAVSGNLRDHSTLRVGVGLLGAFYARQYLDFGETIEAGTPVTIKFSVPVSAVGVAENFSIQPYTNLREEGFLAEYWTADAAGSAYTGANLLTLLGGIGTHEITITPEEDFEGVWVNLSSALSLAMKMEVYHAYIEEDAAEPYTCVEKNTPLDVLSGIDAGGLDLAGSLGAVTNPYNVIDDPDEYSMMSVVVGALNSAYHTTLFQSPSQENQSVRIVLEQPGSLLDLSLLSGFSIQPMLGNQEVGSPIAGDSSLLIARLLSGTQKYELAFPVEGSFDRIKIELNNTVSALQNIRLYEVSRLPRVNLLEEPELTENLTACGQVNLLSTISNYEPDFYTYRFYDQATGGAEMEAPVVATSGTYYIEAEDNVTGCLSDRVAVNATVNEKPEISFGGSPTSYQIAPGESVTFPTATGSNIQWYDDEGNEMASTPGTVIFENSGAYEYRVDATSAQGCVTTEFVTVIVSSDCPPAYPLSYNTGQEFELSELPLLGTQLGVIQDEENAADKDLSTYSTLTEPLNLLGITGETSQTLDFGQRLNAGEKVTVKLAKDYGLASVIGGVFVVAVDSEGNEIGPRRAADPNLAAVVNGLNVFEYSFIPTDNNGVATEFSGVKVILASVLNVVQSVRIYDAFYTSPQQDFVCSGQDVLDVYGGYETILLEADVATGLISTTNEQNAVDNDLGTYAQLNNAVAVNAYNKLVVNYETPAIVGDTLDIVFGHEGSLLDANVLGALRVQRYLDGVPVEAPIIVGTSLLTLRLLSGDGLAVASLPVNVPFDKVKITYGGVANALEQFNIHEVRKRAATQLPGGEGELNEVALCEGEELSLDGLPTDCDTSYILYDTEYGGSQVQPEDIATYEGGEHTLWIQPVRNGCQSLARGVLTLDITGTPDAPEVVSDQIWVGVQGTASLEVQNPDVNLTYNWYDSADNLLAEDTDTYEASNINSDVIIYVETVAGEECASANLTEIHLQLLPKPIIDPETLTVKQGDSDNLITTNAPDGTEVLWFDEAGDQVNIDTNNPAYSIPGDLSPGSYTYTSQIRDPETGAVSEETSVEVTVLDNLSPPTVTPPSATYTEGYTETFTASHDNPDVSFTWYDENDNEVATTPEFTTPDDLPVGDYTYTVTAYDETTDRVSTAIEVPVTVEPLLPPTVDPSSAAYPEGETETFMASHDNAEVTFTWYDADNNVVATTSEYTTPSNLEVGDHIYTVTATDPNTGIESDPAQVDITVIPQGDLLPPDVNPEMAVILEGETADFTASSENTEPVEYVWYDESGNEVFVGENFTTPNDLPVGEHTYEVRSRDEDNPNRESIPTTIVVEVQAQMLPPEVTPMAATITIGQTASFKADSENPEPVEYVWYDSGEEIVVGDNFTTPDDLPIGEHTFQVTSRHPENEENESDPVEITVVVEPLSPPEVVPSEATITEGQTADFSANSENPGPVEYVWYDESGDEVFVGENFTTPDNLQVGEHTYEVTSRNPEFPNDPNYESDAVSITVTVNRSLTPPNVEPSEVTITEGETTTFTASTDYEDVEFVWFDQEGKEILVGDDQYTTPEDLPVGNYTYEVIIRETTNPDIVSEPTTVQLNIVAPSDLEDCTLANAQSNGTTPICVLCEVEDPELAVDGNINTYSRFVAPASVTGRVWQELIFPNGGQAGDTITIYVGSASSLADVNLLGGLSVESYNDNNANNDGGAIGDATIDLEVLTGETRGEISFVAGGDFDRVLLEYQPLLGVLDSGWQIYQAEVSYQKPTSLPEVMEVCLGESATLEATPAEGTTIRWYDAEVGGELLSEENSYTTHTFESAGEQVYYIAVIYNGCEDVNRILVSVEVLDAPGADEVIVDAGGGNYCEGEVATLTATANGLSNPIFNWYFDENKENPVTDADGITYDIINENLEISGLSVGEHTYYVSVKDGVDGCESIAGDLAEVTVTVNASATATDIQTSDVVICFGETAELEASSSTINNPVFNWYNNEALLGEPVFTGATLEQADLTAGSYTYYITVQNDDICENTAEEAVAATIVVEHQITSDDIELPESLSQCVGSTVMLNAGTDIDVENPVFTWYFDAEGNQQISDGTEVDGVSYSVNNGEMTVDGLTGSMNYYVSLEGDNVCGNVAEDLAMVEINVSDDLEAPEVISSEVSVCTGENTILSILNPQDNLTYNWYTEASGGSVVYTGSDFELTNVTSDATYFVEAVGDAGCESVTRTEVTITVKDYATADDISIEGTTEICNSDNLTLEAIADNSILDPIFQWYMDSNKTNPINDGDIGGDVLFNIGADGMLNVSGLNDGTYTYYVSVKEGEEGCENMAGDLAEVTVEVNPSATADDLMVSDAEICLGASITLTGSSEVENASYRFYADADLTTELESTEVSPEVTTTYYVTVSGDGVCENAPGDAAMLTIEVNEAGTPSTDNPEQVFCETNAATLANLEVNEENVVWYAEAEGGEPLTMDTTLEAGTYYAGFDPEESCESAERLAVTVEITPSATSDDPVVSDAEICLGASIALTASSEVENASYRFYADADLTTELESTEVSPKVTTTYYVTVSGDGVCENMPGEAAMITIEVNESGTPTTDNPEQVFCEINAATLANLEVNEENVVWYAEAEGGEPLAMNTTLEAGIYYAGFDPEQGCESAERLAVNVEINPSATSDDLIVSDAEICLGASIALTASSEVENATYRFYADAALTTELESTEVNPEVTTTYYATVSGDGVCENAPGDVAMLTIEVNEAGTPTTADPVQEFCAVSKPLVADLEVNEENVVWYAVAEGGEPLEMNTVLEAGTYYAEFNNDFCNNSERLAIEVTVNGSVATADDIMVEDAEICMGQSYTLSASTDIADATLTFYNDAGLTSEIEDLEVMPEEETTYYVTVRGEGVCENSPGNAATITVSLRDSGTPTTNNTEQTFCESGTYIISDLQVNENNVVWYADAEGENLLPNNTPLENETTYYAGFDPESSCETEELLAINVSLNEDDNGFIEGNSGEVCYMWEETYTTASGMEDYVWMVEGGEIIEGGGLDDDYVSISWYEAEENYVSVSYLDESSCSGEVFATLDVELLTCSDLSISKTVDNENPNIGDEITFTITVSNVGNYPFEDIQVSDDLPSGYRYISSTATFGSYSSVSGRWSIPELPGDETATIEIIVEVLPEGDYRNVAVLEDSSPTDPNDDGNEDVVEVAPICLSVYNEFTPNGDGSNDYFRIDCIEQYPDNNLKIYNRYGDMVFETSGYENDWDGTANKGPISHDRLPVGTYFYVLELGGNNTVKKGWLYLMR
ncbi:Ig-like domain-containing protein [Salegentibacter maritimus]|uniref:Ig-like domain-containing protein n=1 Tax=Salegentibacter maritimus TaxID=2794347 RepID=UPI0018E42C85|nr:gliding motility-associated C-terminal domain-containing protein [Salegentibacter maritimus]MBI6116760.1 gliding motility-associated C-terminal domain-containing protein [Salegentibacter maritimus]